MIILKEYLAIPDLIEVVSKTKAVAKVLSSRSAKFKRRYNVQDEKAIHKRICEIFMVNQTDLFRGEYLQVHQ